MLRKQRQSRLKRWSLLKRRLLEMLEQMQTKPQLELRKPKPLQTLLEPLQTLPKPLQKLLKKLLKKRG